MSFLIHDLAPVSALVPNSYKTQKEAEWAMSVMEPSDFLSTLRFIAALAASDAEFFEEPEFPPDFFPIVSLAERGGAVKLLKNEK